MNNIKYGSDFHIISRYIIAIQLLNEADTYLFYHLLILLKTDKEEFEKS